MDELDRERMLNIIDNHYGFLVNMHKYQKEGKRSTYTTLAHYTQIAQTENILIDLLNVMNVDNCLRDEIRKNYHELAEEAWDMYKEALKMKRIFGE